jgi:hypothetical protein
LATKETVTAAHNKCLNALIDAIIKHKKKKSSIAFIKEDTDVSFKTDWQSSDLQAICTAQQIEQAAVQECSESEGFGVWGLGLIVWNSGFGVWGLGKTGSSARHKFVVLRKRQNAKEGFRVSSCP